MIDQMMKLAKTLTLLAMVGSLGAVELPPPDEPPAPKIETPQGQQQVQAQAQAQVQVQDGGQIQEQGPVEMPDAGAKQAYLGVGSTEVPELLSTHLGLKAGEGVVVRTLDPDGPAAAIGVQENDVLLRVGGTKVGSQDELRDAVQAHGVGDEVEIDLIQEGKPLEKTVKLGDHPGIGGAVPPMMEPMLEGLPEGQAKRVREAIEQNLRAMEGLEMPEIEQPRPEAMKQLEKRMELMFKGLNFQGGGDGGPGVQFMGSSSIRMQDPEGSVEMQSKDGSKQMRVRDSDGKIQWEGPWDTEQDKAAAPDDIRVRINRMNFDVIEDGENGGLRLQIQPGGGRMEIRPGDEEE